MFGAKLKLKNDSIACTGKNIVQRDANQNI